MKTLKIVTPHPELTGNAVFINHDIFHEYGLEFELVGTQSGEPVVQTLLSGAADYTHVLGAPIPAAV